MAVTLGVHPFAVDATRALLETPRGRAELIEAVHRRGGMTVAFVRGLLGWRRVELTLGKRDSDRVEVLDGLAAGDRVVTSTIEAPAAATARSSARFRLPARSTITS